MADREGQVLETFVSLAGTLASNYDIEDFLQMLVDRCSEVLEITAAGVFIEHPSGPLSLVAATTDRMKALEELEVTHEEGPCLEAYRRGQQVLAPDLRNEYERWPTVARYAVEIGLTSVYAFPLQLGDDCIGALNLYRRLPGGFDADDVRLGQAFADVAAIGIIQERRVADGELRASQLQHALDRRVLVEQAKGILSARWDTTTDDAFERLRAHARRHNARVHEVCRRIVEEGFVPD